MILSLQSDKTDYSILKAGINIPWKCSRIKYYVSSINTKANILISTTDDFIRFAQVKDDELVEQPLINFEDKWVYTNEDVLAVFRCQNIFTAEFNASRTLTFKTTSDAVEVIDMSHRAKLLTGLYNVQFPIVITKTKSYTAPDIPVLDYANKLYLVSLQGTAVYSTREGSDYTPSILSSIDTFIKDGKPILINYDAYKPIKIEINTDGLKYLVMQLVDFQYYPVAIKNPLFVIIKVKPVYKNNI